MHEHACPRGCEITRQYLRMTTGGNDPRNVESDSGWGCSDYLIVFPLAGVGTYLVRLRFGRGDAGWEDLVTYLVFCLLLSLLVEPSETSFSPGAAGATPEVDAGPAVAWSSQAVWLCVIRRRSEGEHHSSGNAHVRH